MNLLITGGAGFIGSNLIHLVIDDARHRQRSLISTASLTPDTWRISKKFQAIQNTFSRKLTCATRLPRSASSKSTKSRPSCISRRNRTWTVPSRGPGDFISTNIIGTFNLLEACRGFWNGKFDGKKFHHVSTDEVYGSLGATGLFTETTPYAPNSPYSASKASSDFLVRAYHHTYGLPTVITNCSNNYGPFQFPEKLIPVIIQNVLARKPIPVYGDGMNVRDWLYVRDHAEALWTVLQKGKLGETYNIGGHNEWANIRIVELICDTIDEFVPKLGGNSRKLISFVKDRPGHDRRYAIDATKIQRELGWTPAHKFEARHSRNDPLVSRQSGVGENRDGEEMTERFGLFALSNRLSRQCPGFVNFCFACCCSRFP
jgi:dTDP-glucose 4,6-dehydratase